MKNILLITGLIGIAALSRFLPHPPNFTAIGAMALFGGAMYKRKAFSYIVPVLALWLSDLVLNNVIYSAYYDGFTWISQGGIWIMIGVVAMVIIGIGLIKNKDTKSIILASITGSAVFFLLSNFGAFLSSGLYPINISGLISCYIAALPFFLSTLAGTMFYSAVLFGGYAWISNGYSFKKMVLLPI